MISLKANNENKKMKFKRLDNARPRPFTFSSCRIMIFEFFYFFTAITAYNGSDRVDGDKFTALNGSFQLLLE